MRDETFPIGGAALSQLAADTSDWRRSDPRAGLWCIALLATLVCVCIVSAPASAGKIRLAAGEIDTGNTREATSQELVAQRGRGASLVLVQLDGPIRPMWLERLERSGAVLHHYLPDYAYLATIAPGALARVRALPHVTWVGFLPAALKVHPEVAARAAAARGALYPPGDDIAVTILSVDASAAKRIEALGLRPTSSRQRRMGWHDTRVRVPVGRLDNVAKIWSVFHVEMQPQYTLHGERAAQTVAGSFAPGAPAPFGPGYRAFLDEHGLTGGAGLIAQVQDDGLDRGNASNLPGTAHADIRGRIAGIFNATSDPLGDSEDGHGQLNAGIVMGDATLGATDGDGYLLGQGVAPGARVYATKIFRNGGAFDIGGHTFTSLAKLAQDAGAVVSNNSWGAPLGGAYTADSAEFDLLVRDADPAEDGHQPITYFFSAGNEGPGAGTIGSPGTAKNVITVGAAENSDMDGTDGCGIGPTGADDLNDLIGFSSRGPTDDGRQGVTLVSVGTHNQGPASTTRRYTGIGVCDPYWPPGQTDYARSSGTSHATPTVAGAALVLYEIFREILAPAGHTATPSPALVKAALSATATDLAGGRDGAGGVLTNVPNSEQGWGSANLSNLLRLTDGLTTVDQSHVFTSSGQTFTLDLKPLDPTLPVEIALAWTDAPAVPSANPTLVNDLDLLVHDGAVTYLGNVFSLGHSIAGGQPDARNNLERVSIEAPEGGEIRIRVEARNIAGDGLPGSGGVTDQDFALFAWNAVAQTSAGALDFGSAVSCIETGTIRVSDSDLRGRAVQDVALTSAAGDAETLTLLEEPPGSGIFLGSLATAESAPAPFDGVLQIADGGYATATYDDADDGSGAYATVVALAAVDCTAPLVSGVRVADVTATRATVEFSTNEGTTGRVDFGPSCGSLTRQGVGPEDTTAHAIELSGLTPDSPWFAAVTATDAANNATTDDNGGHCYEFTTPPQSDYYTQQFTGSEDLSHRSLLLTPDGSRSGYEACAGAAPADFPTDPYDGVELPLLDDSALPVSIAGGQTVALYGVRYGSFFVGSNGYVTFGAGDTEYGETIAAHFRLPRVSGVFDDFDPSAGGTVSWRQRSDRVAITWQDVAQFGDADSNDFQIELFFDGRIRITHTDVDTRDGIVGISAGLALPPDFVESDLDAYDACISPAGALTLSPDPLVCALPLELHLSDGDLDGHATASVEVTAASGDSETVVLVETPVDTGLFTASIATLESTAAAGNGKLEVSEGDLVTATYYDADDGTGYPAVASVGTYARCGSPNANLGFELGDLTDWEALDIPSPFVALQVADAGLSPGFGFFHSAPTEGSYALLHGFDGAGPATIVLGIDLPLAPHVESISFDYRAAWQLSTFSATKDRRFSVEIEPAGGGSALQSDTVMVAPAGTYEPDTGNRTASIDVTAFAGQTVRLSFEWHVPESYSGPAFFQLDAVELAFATCIPVTTLEVGTATLPSGGHAAIDVATTEALTLGAMDLEMRFDPAVLQAVAATSTALTGFTAAIDNVNGSVRTASASAAGDAISAGSPLFAVEFTRIGGAHGAQSAIALADTDGDACDDLSGPSPPSPPLSLPYATVAGGVTGGELGDIDCDTRLTAVDATVVLGLFVGTLSDDHLPAPCNDALMRTTVSDWDLDGEITPLDASVTLAKFVGLMELGCTPLGQHFGLPCTEPARSARRAVDTGARTHAARLRVTRARAHAGGNATIEVVTERPVEIGSSSLSLTFDTNVLRVVSVTSPLEGFVSYTDDTDDTDDGTLRTASAGLGQRIEAGTALLRVVFDVDASALPGSYAIGVVEAGDRAARLGSPVSTSMPFSLQLDVAPGFVKVLDQPSR